ncbi:MAG TPA: dCTP deaminase [Acidobacteriota bacterium]|nr:dCTP deaminase [Acidobacteriota bacterium]
MGIKPDHWIVRMAKEEGMIQPFEESLLSIGTISYGPSSYGYDFRVDRHYKLFRQEDCSPLDPKNLSPDRFEDYQGDTCVIPPGSFVLAQSVEYFRIPRDILTICTGKSTYARCGILVNVTPFEPEWEGLVTMSISNTGPAPVRIYSGEGIAQLVFLCAEETCSVSYRDRKGKYQAQRGIVLSQIKKGESEPGS